MQKPVTIKLMKKKSPARFILSAVFLGSGLSLLYLGSIASDYLLYQSGGALAIGLFLLGLVFVGGAVWQYRIGIDPPKEQSMRETLLLCAFGLLLVVPLSLASGIYAYPLLVFALALLFGMAPAGYSVLRERTV